MSTFAFGMVVMALMLLHLMMGFVCYGMIIDDYKLSYPEKCFLALLWPLVMLHFLGIGFVRLLARLVQ